MQLAQSFRRDTGTNQTNIVKTDSNCDSLKFLTLFFLFSTKMLVIRAGIHKMNIRIADWKEDYDQYVSSEAD